MFEQNSAMPEMPQGHDETGATAPRPMVGSTEASQSETPSTPAGTVALAWWDASKYFWRRSASGGYHLAPLDDYVRDVLDRGDHYISDAAKDFSAENSGDLDLANSELAAVKTILESRNAFDSSGIEAQSKLREYINRAVIARKIAGASAVSAEHRVINEMSKPDGNVDDLKNDANGFYQSDIEKRDRWASKACYYEYIASQLADGEIIPTDGKAFAELLAKRIQRSLYDDAVDRGNRLKRPPQGTQQTGAKLSREERLALTA